MPKASEVCITLYLPVGDTFGSSHVIIVPLLLFVYLTKSLHDFENTTKIRKIFRTTIDYSNL